MLYIIYHCILIINVSAYKIKKVLSFITIQYRKIARTVFQAYFYDDKKSYFNNDFYLFFEYFYRKQKFLFLSNSFSRLNLLIFFRFIYKEYRFYLIYQITFKKDCWLMHFLHLSTARRETRNPNLSLILFIVFFYYFLSAS